MEGAKQFWETCHRNDSVPHLSGVQYDKTMDFLRLHDYIQPGIKVLEIGVGLGYVTQALYENGITTSAIDISDAAIARVSEYCENTYTIENIRQLPSDYFDVILCINVVQHIPTDLLRTELRHFIRALKKTGTFALQFVSNTKTEDLGANATMADIKSGTLCRSPSFMSAMIETLGGKSEPVYECNGLKNGKVNGVHVFHIQKL